MTNHESAALKTVCSKVFPHEIKVERTVSKEK